MKICMCGTGYVGLTTGVGFAYLGHDVTCVDLDKEKIESLKQGKAPFYEPHMDEILGLVKDNLSFSDSYKGSVNCADVVFIAVGTPPLPDGMPDLTTMHQAVKAVGDHIDGDFTLVVNKSTAPIGSAEWVHGVIGKRMQERHGKAGLDRFSIASNPEFLRQGSALQDILYPDRVVVGAENERAAEMLKAMYAPLVHQTFTAPDCLPRPKGFTEVPLIITSLPSAELIKYASNAFLATKVSFINELALLSDRLGADIVEVGRGIGFDKRIGPQFLKSGIGWGGSCFGKDTAALLATADEYGVELPIIAAARKINYEQRKLVIDKLLFELKTMRGKSVGLLGLSFKPETDDMRDAPSLDIIRALAKKGVTVKGHDPVCVEKMKKDHPDLQIEYCDTEAEVFEGSDAVVLVTEWKQYANLPYEELAKSMKHNLLIDGRNFLDPDRMFEAGFRYAGIGR